MNMGRELIEIEWFVSDLMNEGAAEQQARPTSDTDLVASSSHVSDEILPSEFPPLATLPYTSFDQTNENACTSASTKLQSGKILSSIGSYFINRPSRLQIDSIDPLRAVNSHADRSASIKKFSLHQHPPPLDSLSSPRFGGLIEQLVIDSAGTGRLSINLQATNIPVDRTDVLEMYKKIKLYIDCPWEHLVADVSSYTIDADAHKIEFELNNITLVDPPRHLAVQRPFEPNQSHPSLKFAPRDQSCEMAGVSASKPTVYFGDANDPSLLHFAQHQIENDQWPLVEYIGVKGHRAWRALKLAADISRYESEFMLNYHHECDWIADQDELGSFGERTHWVIRTRSQ